MSERAAQGHLEALVSLEALDFYERLCFVSVAFAYPPDSAGGLLLFQLGGGIVIATGRGCIVVVLICGAG